VIHCRLCIGFARARTLRHHRLQMISILLDLCFVLGHDNHDCKKILEKSHHAVDNSDVSWLNGSLGGYLSYNQVEERLETLLCAYPRILAVSEIGRTFDGMKIHSYSFGRGNSSTTTVNVLVVAMLYARDVVALSAVLFMIEQLCRETNAGDATLTQLWHSGATLHVVPMVNVDSFANDCRAHPQGGGETVRNARGALKYLLPEDQDKKKRCVGVNLDRNFPVFWSSEAVSRDECQEEYGGHSLLSELESKAISSLASRHRFAHALVVHSLGGAHEASELLYPWFYRGTGEGRGAWGVDDAGLWFRCFDSE
jgi:hypothetical protein